MFKPSCILGPVVLGLCTAVNAGDAVDVGDRRQVFIDGRLLESSQGVGLQVHAPRKTGELTIAQEHPWESRRVGIYGTVMKLGDTYHMWYEALSNFDRDEYGHQYLKATRSRSDWRRHLCYARSLDGIRWEKPMLGIGEFRGSRQNNIVAGHGAGGIQGQAYGMVFLDPNAPQQERLRLVMQIKANDSGRTQLNIYSSPDGIRFQPTYERVLAYHSGHHLDTQNMIFWDQRISKYVAYVRRNLRRPGQHRTNARSVSDRLNRFPDVEDSPVVLGPDRQDLHHLDPVSNSAVPVADIYTSAVSPYSWAQDAYYAFPSYYYHYDGAFLTEFRDETPHNTGSNDIRFAASRDGIRWHRYDRRPFVALGMKEEFDSKDLYMFCGVVPALNGRELYLYYCGKNLPHGWGWTEHTNRLLRDAGLAPAKEVSGISRVVIRRDGFISVQANYAGGEFTTPVLRFEGQELVLNVDTSAAGIVRVEILDANYAPIEGFRLQNCDRIHTANEINRPVRWNGKTDVSKLAGQLVRLRFVRRDAHLYTFQFRDVPSQDP